MQCVDNPNIKHNPVTIHGIGVLWSAVSQNLIPIFSLQKLWIQVPAGRLNRAFGGAELLPTVWKWPDFRIALVCKLNVRSFK